MTRPKRIYPGDPAWPAALAATGIAAGIVYVVNDVQADAQLIAAAPDLLEALKAVEDSIFILGLHTDEDDCEGCQLRTRVRAAIAKAERKDEEDAGDRR